MHGHKKKGFGSRRSALGPIRSGATIPLLWWTLPGSVTRTVRVLVEGQGLTGLSDVLAAPESELWRRWREWSAGAEEMPRRVGSCPCCRWSSSGQTDWGKLWGSREHFWLRHKPAAVALRRGLARTRTQIAGYLV